MKFRTAICFFFGFVLLLALFFALLLSLHNAYVVNLGNSLVPPSSTHLLGTDELGRDVFIRLLAGSKYTILTGVTTVLLAGASGILIAKGAQVMPKSFGRFLPVLNYACFVVPSFLLAPQWPNRLVTAVLCILSILPLSILALIVVSVAGSIGWATSLVLGPLWGIGVAYIFHRDRSFNAAVALMASVFAWSVLQHGVLDALGLGVTPPEPSWGSMFSAQSHSWWPEAAAAFAFVVVGAFAFSLSDIVSRKS